MSEAPDHVVARAEVVDMVGRMAAERLLDQDLDQLPAAVGRPAEAPAPSAARKRIVAVGATLTGVSLLLGIALIALGIGEALSNAVALAVAVIAVGILFVGTHWGWVHVAEFSANSLEQRRDRRALGQQRAWLDTIRPYTRYEVSTSVDDDGSIRIVRAVYSPVAVGEHGFSFTRRVEHEEVHSGDQPGATVAERAELMRRDAAADTEREWRRFEAASEAYENALLRRTDADQELAARRAASEALSERINSNLRDPPLVE